MKEKIEQILINETVHIDSGWDETKWIPQNKVPEIAEAISALFPRWISIDERLPELYAPVLVKTDWGDEIQIGYCEEKKWKVGNCNAHKDAVTHWMPLPELPKE